MQRAPASIASCVDRDLRKCPSTRCVEGELPKVFFNSEQWTEQIEANEGQVSATVAPYRAVKTIFEELFFICVLCLKYSLVSGLSQKRTKHYYLEPSQCLFPMILSYSNYAFVQRCRCSSTMSNLLKLFSLMLVINLQGGQGNGIKNCTMNVISCV